MMNIFTPARSICVLTGLCLLLLTHPAHADKLSNGEWYVRLIAEAPQDRLEDRGNVLGMLNASADLFDRHDLRELPPFAAPYLTIVFLQNAWGNQSGEYASDYRKLRGPEYDTEWPFIVKSDVPRRVTLRWENTDGAGLLENMHLVDMESGEVIKTLIDNQPNNYTFTMTGKTHQFKWIYTNLPVVRNPGKLTRPQS